MTVLAIDTATEACSAALAHDGRVFSRFEIAPRQHAKLLFPMVEALLDEAGCRRGDIKWIAFGRGPGAFTGVRIAAGIAHGLALGLGCGLMPVSTLAALAYGVRLKEDFSGEVLASLDARMGEVYWAAYRFENGLPRATVAECVCPPAKVAAPEPGKDGEIGVGPGWASYEEALVAALGRRPVRILPDRFPDAAVMLELAREELAGGARLVTAADAQPVYLRDRVATPPTR